MTTRRDDVPENERKERGAGGREQDKVRVPAEPVEQRPGEPPFGNGGTDEPAAFPPHN